MPNWWDSYNPDMDPDYVLGGDNYVLPDNMDLGYLRRMPTPGELAQPISPELAEQFRREDQPSGLFTGPRSFADFAWESAKGLPSAVWGAVTLPGDVAEGRVDPNSPEGLQRSLDLAGTVTLGGGMVPQATGRELRAGMSLRDKYPVDLRGGRAYKDKAVTINNKMYRSETAHVDALEEAALEAGYGSLDEAIAKDPIFRDLEPENFGEIDTEGRFVPYQSTEEKPLGSASYEDYLDERNHNVDDFYSNKSKTAGFAPLALHERVDTAAIRTPDGKVYTGNSHFEAFERVPDYLKDDVNWTPEEGFVTNEGRFVDRGEAFNIANRSRQINDTITGQDKLTSEDLDPDRIPFQDRGLMDYDWDTFANKSKVAGTAALISPEPYLRSERFLNSPKVQPKATPDQWRSMMEKASVKPEEMETLGLTEFLRNSPGPVTKEQLLAHIDQNRPRFGETVLGNESVQKAKNWLENDHPSHQAVISNMSDNEILNYAYDQGFKGSDRAKYSTYTTPGGENYREILVTLPEKPVRDAQGEITDWTGDVNNYHSPHWDQPNVMTHMRVNDRLVPDAAGTQRKTLHVEEIQDDWAQAGRKRGYRTPWPEEKIAQLRVRPRHEFEVRETPGGMWRIWDKTADDAAEGAMFYPTQEEAIRGQMQMEQGGHWIVEDANGNVVATPPRHLNSTPEEALNVVQRSARDGVINGPGAVPDRPFKKSWPDLALKRLVKEAVDGGYDQISWTTGKTQADRYNLGNHVDTIVWNPDNQQLQAIDLNGRAVISETVPKEKLSDYIGREPAERLLLSEPDKYNVHTLSGEDLHVGGEGMKRFYDQELVRRANKLFGKYGSKVGDAKLNEGGTNVHLLPITPELKRVVQEEGLPLFANKSKSTGLGTLIATDPDRLVRAKKQGYTVGPLYHASTTGNIKSFKPNSHFGTAEAANDRIHGEDFIIRGAPKANTSYKTASSRESPGINESIYPVYLKGKYAWWEDLMDLSGNGDIWEPLQLPYEEIRKLAYPDELDIVIEYLDNAGIDIDPSKSIEQMLKDAGYSGVQYVNEYEAPGSISYMVFDPKDIRSVAAKFKDPNSSDILAANKSKAAGAATMQKDDEKPTTGGRFAAGGSVTINGHTMEIGKLPGWSVPPTEPQNRPLREGPASHNVQDRRRRQSDRVDRANKTNRIPDAVTTLMSPPMDLKTTAPYGDEDEFRTDISDWRYGVPTSIEGLIKDSTPGRTDRLPVKLPANSYVIPADVVSGLGQGNTDGGGVILDQMFLPHKGMASGGTVTSTGEPVDVVVAGGEYVVSPLAVASIGHGDAEKGHRVLDRFVRDRRRSTIKVMSKLPGPRKD